MNAVQILDKSLNGKHYLVGDSLTIADIAIASILSIGFRLVFDEAVRNTFPRATEWYKLVYDTPAFKHRLGRMWLCE